MVTRSIVLMQFLLETAHTFAGIALKGPVSASGVDAGLTKN
jgi:hypothetical protein